MNRTPQRLLLASALFVFFLAGCEEDPPSSLWDPTHVSGPAPSITGIDPVPGAPENPPLAGVTILTIHGTNFATALDQNLVTFDKTAVPLLSASSTQIQVQAPNLPKDSIQVLIGSVGADFYSNTYLYRLNPAVNESFGFAASEEPYAVECDTAGNIYVSMLASSLGIGVKKFSADNLTRSDYAPVLSQSVASWKGMKFGPGGALFAVAGRSILFRIPPGGGAPGVFVSGSGLTVLNDLDFDQNGNIWTGGTPATSVFRVSPTKVVQAFPFVGSIKAVRVFNSYLYLGAKRDSLEKVFRFPIGAGGDLGAEEVYFDLSAIYAPNTSGVTALAFSSDGDCYVGTDGAAGIIIVHPDKSFEPMYPGLLKAQTVSLAWGKGFYLYQSRNGSPGPKTLVRVNTLKTSAPYYGRTLP